MLMTAVAFVVPAGDSVVAQERPDYCPDPGGAWGPGPYVKVKVLNADGTESSSNTIFPGGSVVISAQSNTNRLKNISFMFFNRDNQYPGWPDPNKNPGENPKGITVNGKPFGSTINTNADAGTVNLPYSFFDVKDESWGGKKPARIQINGYFVDEIGRVSAPDAQCVSYFNVFRGQADGKCSEHYQCGDGVCVTSDPKYPKTCRYDLCQSNKVVRIVDANGQTVQGSTLKNGQFVELRSTAKVGDIKHFTYGFYNRDNQYPQGSGAGGENPRGIIVNGSHLVYGVSANPATNTKTVRIPYSYFNHVDEEANAGGKKPTRIQVNSYFTAKDGRFSLADGNCVMYFNVDHSGTRPQQPTNTPVPNVQPTNIPVGPTTQPTIAPTQPPQDPSDDFQYCSEDSDCGANGRCVDGTCTCKAGTYNCDGDNSNGCESTDNTCGAKAPSNYCKANTDCKGNATCVEGACQCIVGYYNCDGDPNNGCESTSKCNAGGGGGASGSCPAGSQCGSDNVCKCSPGRYDCNNNWSDGCESNSKCRQGEVCRSASDCSSGVCEDNICQPGDGDDDDDDDKNYCEIDADCGTNGKCLNGGCSCRNGFYNCDGNNDNGCESSTACTSDDPSGGPGSKGPGTGKFCSEDNQCGAKSICEDGQCACEPGYYNCDGDNNNGCESTQACRTSADFCTADSDCGANEKCVNGGCSCKDGFYDCDGNAANGCESTTACRAGSANLNIRLKFNGIGVNIDPVTNKLNAAITLFTNSMSEPVEKVAEFTIYGQTDTGIRLFQATVPFDEIPISGGYSVFVKGDHHIQKRVCDATPTEKLDGRYHCTSGNITIKEGNNVLDFTGIYQLAGDLPLSGEQSGFVDSLDITFLRANLGSKDQQDLIVGDLNLDGIVDTQDYSLALYSLSFKYDESVVGEDFRR
ncbi:MAG: hypothetical protein ACOCXQ_02435 [Patescibacteria group bacterium]